MSSLQELLCEDTPLQPTAKKSKQGWPFLVSVLIGCTICVPVFVMGAQLSGKLPFHEFFVAVFYGGIFATAIAIATGIVGHKTALPTAMLAKIAFGRKGYVIANAAMALNAIGWFGIQTGVFSDAFVKLSLQVWGIHLPIVPVTIASGLIMSSTAVIGFRGLGKLSYIATPLLVVLLLAPLYVYARNGALGSAASYVPGKEALTFGAVVAMVAGAYSFACTMPDLTRFMKSVPATVAGMVINFTLAYPLLLILTGAVALAAHEGDYMQIMLNLGFGSLAIVVLFLATWTTNDTNAYSGALSVNVFLPGIERWKLAASVGIIGTLSAVFGIFSHFMGWLIFTGNLFAPMAGVYVADYWLHTHKYGDTENIPAFRWPQILSWLTGLAIGVCTSAKDNMGLGLFHLTTIPSLDALLSAAAVQMALHVFFREKRVLK